MLAKIRREAESHTAESPGHIVLKMNALEDPDVTSALYEACQAGVQVDLIVRDTCRFRPGIPGLSDTARVISIIGRFLEHARVYYFRNRGDEEYFIGSADMMRRNLDMRVEVLAPVEDPGLREDLKLMLSAQLADRRSAWDMQPDGSYVQRSPTADKEQRGSQEALIKVAEKKLKGAAKHKQEKVRTKLLNRYQRRLKRR